MCRRILVFALCLSVTIGIFQCVSYFFFLNITDSLPIGLYIRVPMTDFQRGDYIVYEPSEDVRHMVVDYGWGDGKHVFLKQIGAVPGDHYAINEETKEFLIEGEYRGRVFDTDTQGHRLPQLRGEFTVPEGYVLPVAILSSASAGRR